MKYLWKILRSLLYLLLTLLLLLCLLLVSLGSDRIYSQLPGLVRALTPFELHADIEGNLFGPQRWRQLRFSGAGVQLEAEELRFALDWGALPGKILQLRELSLSDARLRLPPAGPPEPPPPGEALRALPTLSTPMAVVIEALHLDRFRLEQDGEELVAIDQLDLSGSYHGDQLQALLAAQTNYGGGRLSARLQTRDDYPFQLHFAGQTRLPGFTEALSLSGQGSLLAPRLTMVSRGDLGGLFQLQGRVDLPSQALAADLDWHQLSYADYHSRHGHLHAEGPWDRLQLQLEGDARGEYVPPELKLKAAALFSLLGLDRLDDLQLTATTAGGGAQFRGGLDWGERFGWRGDLDVQNLRAEDYLPDIRGSVSGSLSTEGRDEGDHWRAALNIKALNGSYDGQPISGSGRLDYAGERLRVEALRLDWAGNRLAADGSADEKSADVHLQLNAPALHYFLPTLAGSVQGQLQLRGNLLQPELDGDFHWQNLRYGPAAKPVVLSKTGSLALKGSLAALQTQLQAELRGTDIPPLHASGRARISPTRAEDIVLDAQLLAGQAHISGHVNFSPLRWSADARWQGLKPEGQWPAVKAVLSGEASSSGEIRADGTPEIRLLLKRLGGSYRGQALAGSGQLHWQGGALRADKLQLGLGANRLQLDGRVKPSQLQLKLALTAPALQAFYAPLGGSLKADGEIGGSLNHPKIQLQLSGQNLRHGNDFSLRELKASLSDQLQNGGAFNNDLQLSGLQVAGQNIERLHLQSQGLFNRHSLKLQSGAPYQLQAELAGGFSGLERWAGTLNALGVTVEGQRFQLDKPSKLNLSPAAVSVEGLCLHDPYSRLCLDGEKKESTRLRYDIQKLQPQSLARWLPRTLKINSSLSGSGEIRIARNGQLSGSGKLQMTPGSLVLRLEGQAPLVIPLKRFQLEAQNQGSQLRTTLAVDLDKMGQIGGTLQLSLGATPHINGSLRTDIPNIGVFKNHIPHVSQLQGRVAGQLLFAGPLASPQINGAIELSNGALSIPATATELKNMRLRLAAGANGEIDLNGQIGTPAGNLRASGRLRLSPLQLRLNLEGKNMLIANSKTAKVFVTPQFVINIDPAQGIDANGTLLIPEAYISIPDTSAAVPLSKDVVIVNQKKPAAPTTATNNSPINARIKVQLGNKVYFDNKDVKIRLIGGLDLIMKPRENIRGEGRIEVASGNYFLYGQELDIKRGRVIFSGVNIANPTIDFLALRTVGQVEVGASVSGTVKRLALKLTSKPSMSDSFILSYLLFGKAPDGTMSSKDLMEMGANMAIGQFTSDIGAKIHLDVFKLGLDGLKAGKNLSESLYIGMQSSFMNNVTEFLAQYKFNKRLKAEAVASPNSQSLDFIYEYEKD